MRALLLAFACLTVAFGCGDTDAPQAPKAIRLCGELDDIEPVEPTIIGEDDFGCPIFQPVPCTQPPTEYRSLCGSDCIPATAIGSDGDEWFMGCAGGGPFSVGCIDLEFDSLSLCLVDPNGGKVWWFSGGGCAYANIVFAFQRCWDPCDARTEEALREVCP